MRVIIVENDIVSASYIAEILNRGGHDVLLADELYCLDEIRRQGGVDLVITDIFLNDTSGLQIVLDVKGYDPAIKVVAMSGGGTTKNYDYLDYAIEFGADAVVRKPVDEASLNGILSRFKPGLSQNPHGLMTATA